MACTPAFTTGEHASSGSNITNHGRMPQREDRIIPGGDEFMGDKVMIADLLHRFHHRRVVNLLGIIQLTATGIASRMQVADVVSMQSQTTNDVSIHDADVVDVEQQLEVGASDLLDEVHAKVHVIPEVAWMTFHRVTTVSGIQVL